MSEDSASVVEIRLDAEGHRQALIVCPAAQAPAAGQYIQAHAPEDDEAVLAVSLFAGGLNHPGGRNMEGKVEWLSAPGIPASWQPGSRLRLRGPLGRGFEMPANTRKVALAALDTSAARLAPVVGQAVKDNIEVAIFSEAALMDLPSEVEVNALDELAQALNWPDRLLIDMRLDQLASLRERLGMAAESRLAVGGQALLHTAMPCAGLAECGVCAILTTRKTKLACKHGPVFDLKELGY